ncbi:hypothetical protein Sa4125_22700 [Aureimonas sp. SA4125]|uniref:YdcF family protein n=1 Tax=Aureimonas sp. SA4125 TaxID=2826993 RepID=UPI001CC42232|nr:YdcF family protein [Aureimonas sp. SA4125]BDA84728.1 hypothetical protein Sa4125_22700 [Aureimonas sp. SA4125]
MFFIVSKLAWLVLQPLVVMAGLLALGLVLGFFGLRRLAAGVTLLVLVLLLVVSVSPLGLLMTAALENRFPRPELPARITGIVVLGGALDTRVARTRGEVELNEAADRMTAATALALRFPDAKLLFSGGVAGLIEEDVPEVDSAEQFFLSQGIARDRLVLEGRARNTYENAVYARALADPKPGEIWVMITSAQHMPRSVGCFRKAGFDVVPYPVDYRTPAGNLVWRPSTSSMRNLDKVNDSMREYIGLAVYWLRGRTDALFPAPSALAPSVTGSPAGSSALASVASPAVPSL